MKFYLRILFSLLVVPIQTLAQMGEFAVECDPLEVKPLESAVWDFSQRSRTGDARRTYVRIYGDSLMAESIAGRRAWYALSADSIFFINEEDRLTLMRIDDAVAVSPRRLVPGMVDSEAPFSATGSGGGRQFNFTERGHITLSSSLRPGILILSPGDTVRDVFVVRELRQSIVSFDTVQDDAKKDVIRETYRWYDSDGATRLLPLALQQTVYVINLGQKFDSNTPVLRATAYLPDREALLEKRNRTSQVTDDQLSAIGAALDRSVITCDGKTVSVSSEFPADGLPVSIDIVDASGRSYLHEDYLSSGGSDTYAINCSALRSGQYIAVVAVAHLSISPKKQMIIIR